jgi:NAD(P)H-hydrate epimerase
LEPPSPPLSLSVFPARAARRARPGNNGGDGLVAARHLAHFGFDATVVYPVRSPKAHFVNLVRQCEDVGIPVLDGMPDVATAAEAAEAAADDDDDDDDDDDAGGGSGTTTARRSARRSTRARYDVIVDAVFGFSFRGGSAPREPHASAISAMRDMRGRDDSAVVLVSVDVPSGWDVDGDGDGDGSTAGDRLVPDVLVSLTAPKPFARGFRGRHFVGGRFLPPALAEKYGIRVSGVGPFSPLRNAT